MEIKIGIIGTNFISDNFCDAAEKVPGAVLQAVYSRKEETGSVFAKRHSIPEVFTDYEKFLSSDIDCGLCSFTQFYPLQPDDHGHWNTRSMSCAKRLWLSTKKKSVP